MIDFISIAVDTDEPIAVGKPFSVVQPAGHRTDSFTPMQVRADAKAPAFEMRYDTKTKRLKFEGSPIMFLQGHNAFGSDDLQWLVQQTIPLVFATAKMQMPPDVMHRITVGNYSISAVDVTKHFRLCSGTVQQFCEWVRVHAPTSLKATPAERGVGVRLLPNSRSTAFYLYDKAHYFADRGAKSRHMVLGNYLAGSFERIGANMLFNRMRHELENVLRVEAKFKRSLSAKRWKLDRGFAWQLNSADRLFYSTVQDLPLNNISAGSSFEHLVNDASLPPEHRTGIALWLDGRDVASLSSSRPTYYRLRKKLLAKYSLDLSQPPPTVSPIDWMDLVQSHNAIATPNWAINYHFVHTPETLFDDVAPPCQRAWIDSA